MKQKENQMSTLPRLDPNKYRQAASALGGYQPQPMYTKASSSLSQSPPTQMAQTLPSKNTTLVLQGIRESVMRKYDAYKSQIRQLDRNFTLQVRKTDQQTVRTLSKLTDNVSSLNSEMSQLSNQASIISKKLSNLNKSIDNASTTGLQATIRPLSQSFSSFDQDFIQSLSNIDALFSTLSKRTDSVVQDYNDLLPITKSITELDSALKEANAKHEKSLTTLEETRSQLAELMEEQRKSLIQRLTNRIEGLGIKIDVLEKRSATTLQNSQDIVADAQNSQYELRKEFETVTDNVSQSFKSQLEEVKKTAAEMNKNRVHQLEIIRDRLSTAKMSMAKLKRKKMKQEAAQAEEAGPRISLKPEIERLKTKIMNLEQIVKQKKGLAKPSDVRVFYHVDDIGIRYIRVQSDGTVEVL